jgi:DNA-binding transcriptional MocR family regulator
MSIRRILAALETTGLPANEKLVLILLSDHADDETGKCWPSQNYIARRSGLTRETINRTMKRLSNKGLIRIEHRFREDGSSRSNAYFVLPGVRPPCARESHPPVIESHTEPVSYEPITPITPIGSYPQVKSNGRKLSAVEKAAAATARGEARLAAEKRDESIDAEVEWSWL